MSAPSTANRPDLLKMDVGNLYLPAKSEVDQSRAVIEVNPGDRLQTQSYSVGGREVWFLQIVRAYTYPHPSHCMINGTCFYCGARKRYETNGPELTNEELQVPCSLESK